MCSSELQSVSDYLAWQPEQRTHQCFLIPQYCAGKQTVGIVGVRPFARPSPWSGIQKRFIQQTDPTKFGNSQTTRNPGLKEDQNDWRKRYVPSVAKPVRKIQLRGPLIGLLPTYPLLFLEQNQRSLKTRIQGLHSYCMLYPSMAPNALCYRPGCLYRSYRKSQFNIK